MKMAMRKQESRKSGWVWCGIQELIVKAGGYTMVQWLKEIFDVALRCVRTPRKWSEAVTVPPIHKKSLENDNGLSRMAEQKWV